MNDSNIRAIITVLDRTEAPLHAINQRFASFTSPLAQIGARLGRLAEETGLTTIRERAGEAFEKVRDLGGELLEIAGPLAALGAAGSIAGLVEIAKSTAEVEEKLSLAAKTSGIAAQDLAGWQYAAKLANVDTEQLTRGVAYLNRNIALAAGGKAKDVETIFSQMGIRNTPGHLVSTANALKAVAAETQHLVSSGNIQTANALMSKIFGARAGAQMLPLFSQGPDQILEKIKEAKDLGLAPSDEDIKKGAEFEESYKKMSGAVDGLKMSIANELFPALTPVVDKMTAWITANRDWIATGIGDYLASIDWHGIKDGISSIATAFKDVFSWAAWALQPIGGMKAVLAGLVVFSLAPLIESFGGLALASGRLALAIGGVALRLGALAFGGLISSIMAVVPAIGSAADAFAAFDLVLVANPIGAFIAIVGLLGAAAYEIYEHWQPIAEFFKTLWDGISSVFEAAWAKIKPIVDAVRDAIDWVASHMPKVSPTVTAGGENMMFDPSSGQMVDLGPQQPPVTQAPGARPPLTQLPGGGPAGQPAGAKDGQQSQTKVIMDFKNVPNGVQPQVETQGNPDLDMSLGYAFANF